MIFLKDMKTQRELGAAAKKLYLLLKIHQEKTKGDGL